MHASKLEDVDKVAYSWFAAKRTQKASIDEILLKEKALNFVHDLGETEFKGSD